MLYWPVELVPLLSIWINWWSFSLALCPFISLPCKEIYFFSQKFDLIFKDGCHRRKAVVGRGKMKTSSTLVVSRAHRAEDRKSSNYNYNYNDNETSVALVELCAHREIRIRVNSQGEIHTTNKVMNNISNHHW